MNSKDRNEERTKEGCGRVVMHRMANIIHSYSLECGIIAPTKHNQVPSPMNGEFELGYRGLDEPQP
jgi:cytosolic carboxypeptidase protein 5